MNLTIATWGTGSAFGREPGLPPMRARRHQAATSIIGTENREPALHFLIDAGAPCVETMIDNDVARVPDLLFITHPHADHISDFDKLVNSRIRGLYMSGQPIAPFPVVATRECLDDPGFGLKLKFSYLAPVVRWLPVPAYDVWYSVRVSDGALLPTQALARHDLTFPVSFKALPVYHAFAPGACLFIFALREPPRRIVISGDFESVEDRVIDNPDLKDPDAIVLDTNSLKAVGVNHSNWEQNKKLLKRWVSGNSNTLVLLTHLGGFEDYQQGFYDHIPTDDDWQEEVKRYAPPPNTKVEIAEDGRAYSL